MDSSEEGLFELYCDSCYKEGTTPRLSDYPVWLEENYG